MTKPVPMTAWTVCTLCGAVVAVPELHATYHPPEPTDPEGN